MHGYGPRTLHMKETVMNEMQPIRILVAEDDPGMLDFLHQVLSEEGYEVLTASDGSAALRALEEAAFDLVLTDIRMPEASGMDVLQRARSSYLHQPVILMTAFGSIESAVEAMKAGAYSYIPKPFDLDELLAQVGEVAHQIRLNRHRPDAKDDDPFRIVFKSKAFQHVLDLVADVADSQATILVTGESGTGKELIAREIHTRSRRRKNSFVAFNVTAIPENLVESELFGHVRGAFTGANKDKAGIIEHADGGTLFLDEIGDMSLPMQIKLLRFIQERRIRRVGAVDSIAVDVRLVAATNRNLDALIQQELFREDLYYRLSVVNIALPPLRERREDVVELAYHFLRKFNPKHSLTGIGSKALSQLVDYSWPGNVRQLENAIEYASLRRKKGMITREDLPQWLQAHPVTIVENERSLDHMEREHIHKILSDCKGNQSRAARILGIDRRTLARKLKHYET